MERDLDNNLSGVRLGEHRRHSATVTQIYGRRSVHRDRENRETILPHRSDAESTALSTVLRSVSKRMAGLPRASHL